MPRDISRRAQTFEPRTGLAQLIFGIIYVFITLIALTLAYRVYEAGGREQQPWLQYFFALLFAIMAVKSFIIWARARSRSGAGRRTVGTVEEISADHGITRVKGVIPLRDADRGELHIESRFAGETLSREIRAFLDERGTRSLPALVVGENTRRPRGMFLIRTRRGRLDRDSQNRLLTELEH